MKLSSVAYRVLVAIAAIAAFHTGMRHASASQATINDVLVTEYEDHSRIAIDLDEGAGDFTVSFSRSRDHLTLKFPGVARADYLGEFRYKDKLIKSIFVTEDLGNNGSIIDISFIGKGVSLSRSGSKTDKRLVFNLRPSRQVVALKGLTGDEFLRRMNSRRSVAKEDFDKRFVEVDKKYGELSRLSGRDDFLELMKSMRETKEEGLKKSLNLAKRFLRVYPESVYTERVRFSMGDILFMLTRRDPGFLNSATQAYTDALAHFPNSKKSEQALMRLARIRTDQEFYIEAVSTYGSLLRAFPKSKYVVPAMLARAVIYMNRGRYTKSYNELEKILILYPDRREVRDVKYLIAVSYYDRKKYDIAYRIFEEANKIWPTFPKLHPNIYLKIADTRYRIGKKDTAHADWLAIMNLFPNSREGREATLRLADYYAETDKAKSAVKVLENLVHRFPDTNHAALALLRIASMAVDNPDLLQRSVVFDSAIFNDPIKTFDLVRQRNPKLFGIESLRRKGDALYKQKRYLASILAYKELLRLYPAERMSDDLFVKVREDFYRLIDVYHAQDGFYQALMTYYNNFDPFLRDIKSPSILLKIADSYNAITLSQRAVQYYMKVAKYDTEGKYEEETAFRMASAVLADNRYATAVDLFKRYLEYFPASNKNIIARHRLGEALYYSGKEAEAATEWRYAMQIDPESPYGSRSAYHLGQMFKKRGEYTQAIDAFNKAIDTFNPSVDTGIKPEYLKDSYYHIAESYYKSGDYKSSIREARRFEDIYPDDKRKEWMDYLITASLGSLDKTAEAVAGYKELSQTDKNSLIGKVAQSKLAMAEWKKKNSDLFTN